MAVQWIAPVLLKVNMDATRNLFCYVNSMRVKKPIAQGGSFIPPWAIGLREFSADIVWDFKGPDMRAVSYT